MPDPDRPAWREEHVEADGFRIRLERAGDGPPLVYLHHAGGLTPAPAHDLLARDRSVIAFEMPGFGTTPENTRHQGMADMARTMLEVVSALGIERFDLMGTSFGGKTAMWAAALAPERVQALVLEAPGAIRPEGHQLPQPATPEEAAALLYAHPERVPPRAPLEPEQREKIQRMVTRLLGPPRDAELEAAMPGLQVPVLVLLGTEDRLLPTEVGRLYRELLPNCHVVFVYDAGHSIASDRPEAFAEAVSDFLERHEQFVVSRASSVLLP